MDVKKNDGIDNNNLENKFEKKSNEKSSGPDDNITMGILTDHMEFVEEIIKIDIETFGNDYPPEMKESLAEKWRNAFLEDSKKESSKESPPMTVVALSNNKLVGYTALEQKLGDSDEYLIPSEYLDLGPYFCGGYVDPEYRKMGVLKRMMEFCEENMKKLGYPDIYLIPLTLDLKKSFERMGYYDVIPDSTLEQGFLMKKDLK